MLLRFPVLPPHFGQLAVARLGRGTELTKNRGKVAEPYALDTFALDANESRTQALQFVRRVHAREGVHGKSSTELLCFPVEDASIVILLNIQATLATGNCEVSAAAVGFLPTVPSPTYPPEVATRAAACD